MLEASTPGYVDGVVFEATVAGIPGYYMVRGYRHPPGRLLVEPYRVSGCRGRPVAVREYVHCLGVYAYTVPRKSVVRILSGPKSLSTLPLRVRRVIGDFVDRLGLEWAGVTGSYAVGCERQDSDVDILGLYRKGILKALRDLYEDGLIHQCKMGDVMAKRGRGPGGVALDHERIERSLTDSCYRGIPYTLRLLTVLQDAECTDTLTPLGVFDGILYLEPVGEPITVPTRYMGIPAPTTPAGWAGEIIVETWRTRYQELPPGYYRVRGLVRLDCHGHTILSPDHGGVIEWAQPPLLDNPN